MTYAFTQDVPIDAALYRRILDGLGAEPPRGLVIHVAMELPGGGLRYVDVWESKADSDRFEEERLHPVVHPLLQGMFGGQVPPDPERTPVSVIHVWRGTAAAPTP